MYQNRITNTLLAVIATLLALNLVIMLSTPAHAMGKTQYKVVSFSMAEGAQQALEKQSSDGWEYVGSVTGLLIFKK